MLMAGLSVPSMALRFCFYSLAVVFLLADLDIRLSEKKVGGQNGCSKH